MNQSDLDALKAEADELEADLRKQIADFKRQVFMLQAKGDLERAQAAQKFIAVLEALLEQANQ